MRDTLPGLVMAQQQWVRWHLLNMGSTEDIHSVHFHGQTFSVRTSQEYHMGVYNLYPGEIQHEHCTQPSCVALCPCLLGCAKPVGDSENGEWVWKSQAVSAQRLAPRYHAMAGNSLLLSIPAQVSLGQWRCGPRTLGSGRWSAKWGSTSKLG